jgi:hypothetical protein
VSVAHVVLFDLRPDLDAEGTRRFCDALMHALGAIPTVQRCRVGRRLAFGAGYEHALDGYAFMAVIEFEDLAALRVYLDHPAHAELGAMFWSSTSRTLVLDFELAGDDLSRAFASWSS